MKRPPAHSDPWVAFDAWAQHNEGLGGDDGGFNADTTRIYRTIWTGWLRWLAAHGLTWHTAGAADAARFLSGPAPAPTGGRGRKPKDAVQMAKFTSQRYWRVLTGVYAHARKEELVPENPMLDIEEADRPKVDRRSREPQVLPARVLEVLRDPRQLEKLAPQDDPAHWWVLRDRAAIALLAHGAPTAGELLALRGEDLRVGARMLTPGLLDAQRLPLEGHQAPPVSLDLPKPGGGKRSVELPAECLAALLPWLIQRERLLEERRTLLKRRNAIGGRSRDDRGHVDDVAALQPSKAPLLLSQRAADGPLLALETSSAWHAVRRVLAAAYALPKVRLGPEARVARGATIVRNTVVRDWVERFGEQEAVERAGLRSTASLRTH